MNLFSHSRARRAAQAFTIIEIMIAMTIFGMIVAAIFSLWNFSPGWSTPLLYRLTSGVGLSPETYGLFRAVHYAAMAAAIVMYGYLCERQPIGRILRWTISLNVLAGGLFFLITGPWQAIPAPGITSRSCRVNSKVGTMPMSAAPAANRSAQLAGVPKSRSNIPLCGPCSIPQTNGAVFR